jgi:hypothetical protein
VLSSVKKFDSCVGEDGEWFVSGLSCLICGIPYDGYVLGLLEMISIFGLDSLMERVRCRDFIGLQMDLWSFNCVKLRDES